MTLDRRACLSLCFVSVILMLGSGILLWSRWDKLSQTPSPKRRPGPSDAVVASFSVGTGWPPAPPAGTRPATKTGPAAAAPKVPSISVSTSPAPPAAVSSPVPGAASTLLAAGPKPVGRAKGPAVPASEAGRNIRFTLRDSRPSRVEISGSFNNWVPTSMAKGDDHIWEVAIPLTPGEYTYNFLVDGKPIRDPNNPRTAPEGRSLLVVKPK